MLLEEPQQLEAYILKTKDKYVYSRYCNLTALIKGQTMVGGVWQFDNYFSRLGSACFFRWAIVLRQEQDLIFFSE